jgi:anti-sigma regulatory factor (Ser/Thr protein kinase)
MMGWLKIGDPSAVAEARRRARRIAFALGISSTRVENVAIVATEIAQNVLRHGGGGKMLVQPFGAQKQERLYVIGLDEGPGIQRVERMLQDGQTTSDSPGTGLGAIKRLSDRMDIDTAPGAGTVITAEFSISRDGDGTPPDAGLCLPYPGERRCGDSIAARVSEAAACYLVCDGLGHGAKAATASGAARNAFLASDETQPGAMLAEVGEALQGTRGAVAAISCLDRASGRLDYAAIGNIATIVLQDGQARRLPVRDGLLGGRRASAHEETLEIGRDAVVIMHSDGLSTLRRLTERPPLFQRSATAIAARLLQQADRERDDASILVARMTAGRTL